MLMTLNLCIYHPELPLSPQIDLHKCLQPPSAYFPQRSIASLCTSYQSLSHSPLPSSSILSATLHDKAILPQQCQLWASPSSWSPGSGNSYLFSLHKRICLHPNPALELLEAPALCLLLSRLLVRPPGPEVRFPSGHFSESPINCNIPLLKFLQPFRGMPVPALPQSRWMEAAQYHGQIPASEHYF